MQPKKDYDDYTKYVNEEMNSRKYKIFLTFLETTCLQKQAILALWTIRRSLHSELHPILRKQSGEAQQLSLLEVPSLKGFRLPLMM
jgi:hypothetical protein